jgi:hypothetical protein
VFAGFCSSLNAASAAVLEKEADASLLLFWLRDFKSSLFLISVIAPRLEQHRNHFNSLTNVTRLLRNALRIETE